MQADANLGEDDDTVTNNGLIDFVTIELGGGNDTYDSRLGDQESVRVFGDDGNDTFYNGQGYLSAWGGAGNDQFIDVQDPLSVSLYRSEFFPGDGADNVDSTTGQVAVRYYDAPAGITADLALGSVSNDGWGNIDTLIAVEGIGGSGFNDTLNLDDSDNLAWTESGNDIINALGGDDDIIGGAGNDTLDGGDGEDTLNYGWSYSRTGEFTGELATQGAYVDLQNNIATDPWGDTDTISNFENALGTYSFGDTLIAASTGSYLWGGNGNDTLIGGAGDDHLDGYEGDDSISGGDGADLIWDYSGNDTLTGGDGVDHFDFYTPFFPIGQLEGNKVITDFDGDVISFAANDIGDQDGNFIVDFNDVSMLSSVTGGDTLISLPSGASVRLQGYTTLNSGDVVLNGSANVTLSGTTGPENIVISSFRDFGGADLMEGDDTITITDDVLTPAPEGSATGSLFFGAGNDELNVYGQLYNASVYFGPDDDNFYNFGDLNNSFLAGEDGNDYFQIGSAYFNAISGGSGNDYLTDSNQLIPNEFDPGPGSDTADSTLGILVIDYRTTAGPVDVDLNANQALDDGFGFVDTLIEVEGIYGSPFDDVIAGNSLTNYLSSGSGNDTVSGGTGLDQINPGPGNDEVDGGPDFDHLHYNVHTFSTEIIPTFTQGVNANLATNTVIDPWGGTDTVTNIESILGTDLVDTLVGYMDPITFSGNDGADTLTGGSAGDQLIGGDGIDTIHGMDGNDLLNGGAGADILTGGLGADIFSYYSQAEFGDSIAGLTNIDRFALDAGGDIFGSDVVYKKYDYFTDYYQTGYSYYTGGSTLTGTTSVPFVNGAVTAAHVMVLNGNSGSGYLSHSNVNLLTNPWQSGPGLLFYHLGNAAIGQEATALANLLIGEMATSVHATTYVNANPWSNFSLYGSTVGTPSYSSYFATGANLLAFAIINDKILMATVENSGLATITAGEVNSVKTIATLTKPYFGTAAPGLTVMDNNFGVYGLTLI